MIAVLAAGRRFAVKFKERRGDEALVVGDFSGVGRFSWVVVSVGGETFDAMVSDVDATWAWIRPHPLFSTQRRNELLKLLEK